jgi:endonuclease/exonuclease/phosphatase family metal-dependent hydrolase
MRLLIASYNIHKCIGGVDRRYDPARVRDAVAPLAPDILLLQEVDEGARRSLRHRQVDVLGDLFELPHRAFYPNVMVRGGGHYGNAVLSRFPITEAFNIDLTIPGTKRRSVLHARIRVRRHGKDRSPRTIHVFNLHLGLAHRLRLAQLRRFLASHAFRKLHSRTPIVLAGDFNDARAKLGEMLLTPEGFRGPAKRLRTFPAVVPVRGLDAIYVRGDAGLLNVNRSNLPAARWASDHRPLLAEIRLR